MFVSVSDFCGLGGLETVIRIKELPRYGVYDDLLLINGGCIDVVQFQNEKEID